MIDIFDEKQFIQQFLKISDKSGKIIPFELNRAQLYILHKLKEQKKRTGRIRALILKGRQQGVSTLIQALFFHKVLTSPGTQAFILTHLTDSTRNLFDITKRFNDELIEGFAPQPEQKSHNRLSYGKPLNSGYRVGTAGSKNVGRSATVQLMHCSEYAFFENIQDIKTGVLQTIADIDDTAILKESTANGQENDFFREWETINSEDYTGDYITIFVPWYWQDEYKAAIDDSFTLTDEEKDILDEYAYDGLTKEHLAWRRNKVNDFAGDYEQKVKQFNQEYPFCAMDAFMTSFEDSFIHPDYVKTARKSTITSDSGLVVGVDPALKQTDRCAISYRRGRVVDNIETFYGLTTMQIVGKVEHLISTKNPVKVFIDAIGIGAGIVDRLHEMGYSNTVVGVNVANKAKQSDRYYNVRAEIWDCMLQWLIQELGVRLPDDHDLQKDMCSLGYTFRGSKLLLESKEQLKKRGGRSPDMADSLALTFYFGQYIADTGNLYQPAPSNYNDNLC